MKSLFNGLSLILAGILIAGMVFLVSRPPRGEPITLRPAPIVNLLVVHIGGEVENPGVYRLPPEARIRDAIEAAGGLTSRADPNGLNQAAALSDGEQVLVPGLPGSGGSAAADPKPAAGLVNINTATLAELEALPGIGPMIAQRIIDYREENGAFQKSSDIVNVPGIGPSIYTQIENLITAGQ